MNDNISFRTLHLAKWWRSSITGCLQFAGCFVQPLSWSYLDQALAELVLA